MDSEVESLLTDRLIVGDLKYHDNIPLVMGSKGAEALTNGVGMLDENRGPSDDVSTITMSDAVRLLVIFVAI